MTPDLVWELYFYKHLYNATRGLGVELTISSKGWVVIPADLRKKYGLKPGDRVVVVDYGGVLALVPAFEKPVDQAVGMFEEGAGVLVELVEEHRQEVARDRR